MNYTMYICEVLRERGEWGEVSNECWSSEIGGASRRRNMGPPFGRPHKSCIHRYREMGMTEVYFMFSQKNGGFMDLCEKYYTN